MKMMMVLGNAVQLEKHGYRTRMWLNGATYIGSFYPGSKSWAYSDNGEVIRGSARNTREAAERALSYHFFERAV